MYTRTSAKEPWARAVLDINSVQQHGRVKVDPPTEAELPTFVADYVNENGIELKSGTIVVWDKPDKLSARSAAKLRDLILDDFGVVSPGQGLR